MSESGWARALPGNNGTECAHRSRHGSRHRTLTLGMRSIGGCAATTRTTPRRSSENPRPAHPLHLRGRRRLAESAADAGQLARRYRQHLDVFGRVAKAQTLRISRDTRKAPAWVGSVQDGAGQHHGGTVFLAKHIASSARPKNLELDTTSQPPAFDGTARCRPQSLPTTILCCGRSSMVERQPSKMPTNYKSVPRPAPTRHKRGS